VYGDDGLMRIQTHDLQSTQTGRKTTQITFHEASSPESIIKSARYCVLPLYYECIVETKTTPNHSELAL